MKDQIGARMVFEQAKNSLALALGWDGTMLSNGMYGMTLGNGAVQVNNAIQSAVNNAVISQSYLRLEQLLTTTATNYQFPVLNTQTSGANTIRATEQRLNQQDCFYCSSIGVTITKASSAAATNLQLMTYPNNITFPTAGGVTPNALYSFYSGLLKLTVNNSVIIPALDLEGFQVRPQTQLTAATNSPETEYYGAGETSPRLVIEPNLLFIGSKNSQLEIILKGAISALDANVYAVIQLYGVLMQNVTVVS
jgi:hypothetical protein